MVAACPWRKEQWEERKSRYEEETQGFPVRRAEGGGAGGEKTHLERIWRIFVDDDVHRQHLVVTKAGFSFVIASWTRSQGGAIETSGSGV